MDIQQEIVEHQAVFQGFRSPNGEKMVLEQNQFIEGVLPTSILVDPAGRELGRGGAGEQVIELELR